MSLFGLFARDDEPRPAVSIVMPTLNQAPFIAEAIASVMSQQVDGMELVVADGGSTDGTLDILAGLAAEHAGRLRWTSAPDGGPAQAVNAAVDRARAGIIGWLNSDDRYTPGAVARALAHLQREPSHVMVYGEAEHVDEQGRRIAAYPTRPPSTPLIEWADGCHICQPSAFFRRDTFVGLGGLDTMLRAAFDFDLWLRVFKAYPGRVGYLPEVQAQSRLHAAAITMRFRERVAMEGIQVVHRHLGAAPGHWLLTHFAERQARHPFQADVADLVADLRALVKTAAPWLASDGPAELERHIDGHRALQLARPGFYATVHVDGWAPPVLDLRLRQPVQPYTRLRVTCRHASPRWGPLHVDVCAPDGHALSFKAPWRGAFVMDVPVTDQRPEARLVYRVRARETFVPAEVARGSTDTRPLAFLVDAVELIHDPSGSMPP